MRNPYLQHTLRAPIDCIGRGLHTGQPVAMTIRPARSGTGVVFRRRDVPKGNDTIPALWHRVSDTEHATTLTNDHGIPVRTVEHLLAALAVCEVDNAVVELDGPEVPIMDGSAAPFVDMINAVGRAGQNAERMAIWIHRAVEVTEGDRMAMLAPGLQRCMTVTIDFPDPAVGLQAMTLELSRGAAARELAAARTFAFRRDLDALRARGLAQGGSLANAVLVEDDGIANPEGLRFEDEFVRHKTLDSLGDLSLAGAPIIGHFYGFKPGHALNTALLKALFDQRDAWSRISLSEFHGLWPDEERFLSQPAACGGRYR